MLEQLFTGLFDTDSTAVIAVSDFFLCMGSALLIGLLLTACYTYRTRATKSFAATLALLPAVVCVVIMMVNGNVGTGVAVAGAFSLVRFRSAPGSAREIGAIFLAMCTGLLVGMGYLGYAFLCAFLLGGVSVVYNRLNFGTQKQAARDRTLHIDIPEDLNYTDVFDPVLCRYAETYELTRVKTTNLGSLFALTYTLTLKDAGQEKQLIDDLRCLNGNLDITVCRQETPAAEL